MTLSLLCDAWCAGGIPTKRFDRRGRPATAPPPSFFDPSVDWPSQYAQSTGRAYHAEQHFVEAYADEVVARMPHHGPPLPSAEDAWKDVKNHAGRRGEFRNVYASALAASRAYATADSIRDAQDACMRAHGSRLVSE